MLPRLLGCRAQSTAAELARAQVRRSRSFQPAAPECRPRPGWITPSSTPGHRVLACVIVLGAGPPFELHCARLAVECRRHSRQGTARTRQFTVHGFRCFRRFVTL